MQQINFKASLRLTTHTITEERTEGTFSWHQWIQLKKEQLSDVTIFFQNSKLLFKCFSYRMAGLQGSLEYYAHRCCQNEHSLLSQFTPWLEIGENCLQVIQFVICLFLIIPWKLLHTGYFGIKQRSEMLKLFFFWQEHKLQMTNQVSLMRRDEQNLILTLALLIASCSSKISCISSTS